MALESILHRIYTHQSDVWSYGKTEGNAKLILNWQLYRSCEKICDFFSRHCLTPARKIKSFSLYFHCIYSNILNAKVIKCNDITRVDGGE